MGFFGEIGKALGNLDKGLDVFVDEMNKKVDAFVDQQKNKNNDRICPNCGAPIPLSGNFCSNCGAKYKDPEKSSAEETSSEKTNWKKEEKNASANNDADNIEHNNHSEAGVNNEYCDNQNKEYSVYEKFYIGNEISFIITDKSIITKTGEYLYIYMYPIQVVNIPLLGLSIDCNTRRLKNGTDHFSLDIKKEDEDRFIKLVPFINNKINTSNSSSVKKKNYKYIISEKLKVLLDMFGTPEHTIEVYDNYIITYGLNIPYGTGKDIYKILYDAGHIIYFSEIREVEIDNDSSSLRFYSNTATFEIHFSDNNAELATEIVKYIREQKSKPSDDAVVIPGNSEKWDHIVGENKTFFLSDDLLFIPAEMDLFNSFRFKFLSLAADCADQAADEYNKKIHDLVTYLEFFPNIYRRYFEYIVNKAVGLLLSEGLLTVSFDSVWNNYIKTHQTAYEYYNKTILDIKATLTNNCKGNATGRAVANIIAPSVSSVRSTSTKGLARANFQAQTQNFKSGFAESILDGTIDYVTETQQVELYRRVDMHELFRLVYVDYSNVYNYVALLLKKAGTPIWLLTKTAEKEAISIYKNLSNPDFPEDKKLESLFRILKLDPYIIDFHKYMISQWGDNEETFAIRKYFGFDDFDKIRK